MKKTVLAALLGMVSVGAFAAAPTWTGDAPTDGATDSASAAIEFVASVPTILDGNWITFTGASGGVLKSGKFDVQADGQFATTDPVVLELHYYDPDSALTGDKVVVGEEASAGVALNSIQYSVTDIDFVAGSEATDVSTAEALIKVNDTVIEPEVVTDATAIASGDEATTSWTIENKSKATVFGHVAAGDTISARATVTADIDFVSASPATM
ncbi:hypothetical protein [Vibrio parahaemolyticus]|uniref:hypothetical protein n=1 Tax=Vibrio parahaemolyticus TaxID=670 RepID=UPI0038919D9D